VDRAWHVRSSLDLGAMAEAAGRLAGEHDFSAFMAAGSYSTSAVRTISAVSVERDGDGDDSMVRVRVTANGFLYNMVRIIAGTLVHVGMGRLPASVTAAMLETGDRRAGGITAPACGLYLAEVVY
jgi:tRNA pseudouridine38-40 synthase